MMSGMKIELSLSTTLITKIVDSAKGDETRIHEGADITAIFFVCVPPMEVVFLLERLFRGYAEVRETGIVLG